MKTNVSVKIGKVEWEMVRSSDGQTCGITMRNLRFIRKVKRALRDALAEVDSEISSVLNHGETVFDRGRSARKIKDDVPIASVRH